MDSSERNVDRLRDLNEQKEFYKRSREFWTPEQDQSRANQLRHLESTYSKDEIPSKAPEEKKEIWQIKDVGGCIAELNQKASENIDCVTEKKFRNHEQEFHKLSSTNLLEQQLVKERVNPHSIMMPQGAENRGFWNDMHNQHPSDFKLYADKHKELENWINAGKNKDDLEKDPNLKKAANFWLSERPVKLSKYGDSYFADAGNHRVALAKIYGFENLLTDAEVSQFKRR